MYPKSRSGIMKIALEDASGQKRVWIIRRNGNEHKKISTVVSSLCNHRTDHDLLQLHPHRRGDHPLWDAGYWHPGRRDLRLCHCRHHVAALPGIVALGIIGVMGQVVASALGTPMIWGVILIQVIMYALAKEGVTKFFANWIISRKVVKGRPWLYSFFVLLGAFIVAIVSPFPALLIFWDIVYATCDNFKQPHNCRWSQFMILGVTFSAGLGVVSLPMLTSNGITVFANYQAIAGESMTREYVHRPGAAMLLSVGIYILLCKFVFKPDITPFKAIDVTIADQSALKLGRRQVIVMLAMLVLLLILFAPYLLPAEWGLTAFMSNLGLSAPAP